MNFLRNCRIKDTLYYLVRMIFVFESFPDSSVCKESTCNAGDSGSIPRLGRSAGEGIAYPLQYSWLSLVAQLVKNLPAMQDLGLTPGLGWSPGERKGHPLQYSGPENSIDCISPWGHKESDVTFTFVFEGDVTIFNKQLHAFGRISKKTIERLRNSLKRLLR